jgi:Leucine-rich repeat (LRR) protein
MKRIAFTLLAILSMAHSLFSQNINIPDKAFLNALIALGVDTNSDGLVSYAEAEEIDSLDVHGKSISDLTGIKAFKNLANLNCHDNQLSSLDMSGNNELIVLWCDQNKLTYLDVSKNTSLSQLSCSYNQLTSLDVSKNTSLYYVGCSYNQLTSLDVSMNKALLSFHCEFNQ